MRKTSSGLEGLLEIVGLKVTMEGIKTGTSSESRRVSVIDFRGCNAASQLECHRQLQD